MSGEFSDYGHVVSVLLGLACYPLTRGESVRERARVPMYRPWRAPVVAAAPAPAEEAPPAQTTHRPRHRWWRRRLASRAST